MLIYKSGRFYCGDTSFKLPHACKVITDPPVPSVVGISFLPLDESFTVEMAFAYQDENPEQALDRISEDLSSEHSITPPKAMPFLWGGLKGWEVTYPSRPPLTHEIWIEVNQEYDFGTEEKLNILTILLTSATIGTIDEIKANPTFSQFMDSIRLTSSRPTVDDAPAASSNILDNPAEVERLKGMLITETAMPIRTRNGLTRNHYDTVFDIVNAGPIDVRSARNLGEKAYIDVIHLLESLGLDTRDWWQWAAVKPIGWQQRQKESLRRLAR